MEKARRTNTKLDGASARYAMALESSQLTWETKSKRSSGESCGQSGEKKRGKRSAAVRRIDIPNNPREYQLMTPLFDFIMRHYLIYFISVHIVFITGGFLLGRYRG